MSKNINYLINAYKAVLAFTGLIIITILLITKTITTDAGMPIITMIVGYAIGNGIAAATGKPMHPIIGSNQQDESS